MPASDADLVHAARAGDKEAFSELVLRHQDRVCNLVTKFTRRPDLAEDVAQKVFINAFRRLGEFEGGAAFSTWLYRIAFNESISALRSEGRRRTISLDAGGEDGPAFEPAADPLPPEGSERREERDRLQTALARINPEDRQILLLREMEGLDYAQISSILEVPVGTVRSRLHRARESLREAFKAS
jgi:RNA polymerase sigma-70 factor (ECF subfamily)